MNHTDNHIPGFEFMDDASQADVIFLANDYDVTSSAIKGTDKAPAAIKKMLEKQIETRERYTGLDMSQKLKWHWHDMSNINGLTPEDMVAKTKKIYQDIEQNKLVIGIGGDHSIPIGIFQAIAEKQNPNDITILHIDAHFDLRDIDEFRAKPFGKFAHCCVMRRAHELGFNIVSVGIRDYSAEELEYAQKNKSAISFFEMPDIKLKNILSSIKTKLLYISIDLDGFDPSVFPVTGTQVPGGISWDTGIELLQKTIASHTLIGADICETAVSDAEPFATYRTIFSAAKLAYLIPCLALK